jgi:hypothetical protein
LDILYIDVVLGLRFWVLQEGVFGFLKKLFWGKGLCMHLKALFYFIFACNGPHGLAIIKKHLKNLPAFFSNINVRDVMLQQHSCKLDIQY